MSIIDNLNGPQKLAVEAGPGPVLVLAGPGSGKTRVLTHRIAYLIEELQISPWNIMAVTFTNKAAREMRYRIESLLGGNPRGITMGTFHATCVRILRRESDSLPGYDSNFLIFDTDDQRQVAKRALQDLGLDDKKFPPNKMLSGISSAKNELVTPEEYAASNYISEITRRVYQQYQAILVANNAMDFDDLLMNTVLLLGERADVLQKYQEKYHHILVDEFQDTNSAQYALLRQLADHYKNILAVGDADQSIYKWRGADFRNINRFRQHFPDSQIILLEENYRSTQIILDAAKSVIRHNQDRVDKELHTQRQGGEKIALKETYNDVEEAETVVATIEELVLNDTRLGDCAVMYRTNAQSRVLEEAFLRAGINYRLVGATRFYSRREIKDLIAYLRVVHSLADSVSFSRILNTPPRGIGRKTSQLLNSWSAQIGRQPAQALLLLVEDPDLQHPFTSRAYKSLTHFGQLLSDWLSLKESLTVAELLDTIVEGSGFQNYLNDGTDEGRDRWANVMELRNVASEFKDLSLNEFLEQVALVSDVDDLDDDPNAPTLLTLHSAKGLEFPVVFIVGLEEGMLPHSRSQDDAEELAEERRLFYVGLTRAEDRVFLSYAFRRSIYGGSELTVPSRFLAEIPSDLMTGGTSRSRRQQTKQRASEWNWSSSKTTAARRWDWGKDRTESDGRRQSLPEPYQGNRTAEVPRESAITQPQYRTGQNVHHAKFGDGIVVESKLTGVDEEIVVAFTDSAIGIKKLVASLAKLEIRD
jgi:DNA helicase-2/ATP-dependent DNA helicase PcrA